MVAFVSESVSGASDTVTGMDTDTVTGVDVSV